ncbi:MAG: PhoH family protein [Erysipelothrix sp.]|nr:PhoH family protein [Erysipelothrix sp.]
MAKLEVNLNLKQDTLQKISGVHNENLTYLENYYKVSIQTKSNGIVINGQDNLEVVESFFYFMIEVLDRYDSISISDLRYLISLHDKGLDQRFIERNDEVLVRTFSGKPIRARTLGQRGFIEAVKSHDLTFAIGPAGTGKTFLAVCYAISLLKEGTIKRIILTRPAVEAGENLGFLPGDLKEKVDPYLRPIYDALDDLLSSERVERYIEKGVIEIAPLAYMRGRTLDDALVILDEAQNTTKSQMMMFLTRLGNNSKMIVNGDIEQIDLPRAKMSGLVIAQEYLQDIEGISFVNLTYSDIVRHPLVIKILERFKERESVDA